MAVQDHDWFTIIIAELLLWTALYWQSGHRWKLLFEAVDGKATFPGGPATSGGESAQTPANLTQVGNTLIPTSKG